MPQIDAQEIVDAVVNVYSDFNGTSQATKRLYAIMAVEKLLDSRDCSRTMSADTSTGLG